MTDGGKLMGDGCVSPPEQRSEDRLGFVPCAVILRPDVAEAVQLMEQLAGPGWIEAVGGVGLEPAEDVEIVVEAPGALVEAGDLAAVEDDRLEGGVGARELAEEAVAGELDAKVEALATGGAREQHGIRAGAVGAGVQALQRAAIHPERRLAVADPEQVDALAAPAVGDRGGDSEPVGGPERPEALAELAGAVVEPLGLGEVDAADGPGNEQLIRVAHIGVDEGADPVAHLGDAIARVPGVAQHAGTTLPIARTPVDSQTSSEGPAGRPALSSVPAPVAQGIERCPAEAEA